MNEEPKAIVAYYSQTGNTEEVAGALNEKLVREGWQTDVIYIEPEEEKDYDTNIEEAKSGVKVEIKDVKKDLEEYEILCLGTPVWCGAPATPVNTYLSGLKEVSDTRVLIFTTHGGGGPGNTFDTVSERLKKKGVEIKETLSIFSGDVSSDVMEEKVSKAVSALIE